MNMRPARREMLLVVSGDGVISCFDVLEYDLRFYCSWKHEHPLHSFDYLGPLILTKYKDRFDTFFLDIDSVGVNLRFYEEYKDPMDVTDLQDICFWRTYEMMLLVYPQTVIRHGKVVHAIRLKKIGGKETPVETNYLPEIGMISVCLCLERSRYLLTSNFEGHLRRFHLKGTDSLYVEEVDDWKLKKNGVTIIMENFSKRSLIIGTDDGEVIIAHFKNRMILQKIKYKFPVHWICERNFDKKQVQMLVTGPEPTQTECWPITERTYRKGYQMPRKLASEDNPYLRLVMLEGSEDDIDSEMGREFNKRPMFKRRKLADLPPKPLSIEERLE